MYKDISHDERKEKKKHSSMLLQGEHERKKERRGQRFYVNLCELHSHEVLNTTSGHCTYLVMPYGLVNAPPVFQTFVNELLREFLNQLLLYTSITFWFLVSRVHHVLEKLLENHLFVPHILVAVLKFSCRTICPSSYYLVLVFLRMTTTLRPPRTSTRSTSTTVSLCSRFHHRPPSLAR